MRFANKYGYCELNPFPGCSQIVVSNHAYVYPEHRGKGHGRENHKRRLKRAKALGYDLALCTVRADNAPEIAILSKGGWQRLLTFRNTETERDIELWAKKLREDSH